MSYLCVATEAAASRANCLMTLSSRYFCSHLVMSASRARMRSSFSLRCSIRALALYSVCAPVRWELPCLCSHTHTHTHTLEHGSGRLFLSEPTRVRQSSNRARPESDSQGGRERVGQGLRQLVICGTVALGHWKDV